MVNTESDIRQELCLILGRHIGRDSAISAGTLAERFGYRDDRIIRKAIEELIDEEGIPVCSVTEDPPGYFIAATREEAERYTRSLRRRAVLIFMRRKKVIRNAGLHVPEGQRRLL